MIGKIVYCSTHRYSGLIKAIVLCKESDRSSNWIVQPTHIIENGEEIELKDIEIDKLIDFLQMYKETYEGNGWDKLTIDFRKMDWDDDLEITIDGNRLEADKEFEDRLAQEKRTQEYEDDRKKRQEMQDRADYERLKRKFEQNENKD